MPLKHRAHRTLKLSLSSVHSLSRVQLFATPWTAARQASLPITNSQSSLKLMPIESVMPSNHLILCRPLLFPPSIFPSIRVFSNESVLCIRWPEYWSFNFSLSPSNEHPGLISFRMDWLDLLAIQGTLKNLFQHHSSKASILQCSAFFVVQLSHPYMTTGKTIALTRWTFVGKLMSLLFNMLSMLVNKTKQKTSEGDGIPVELFQILEDDAVRVLHSICQQIWKTQQWPLGWKRSVSIPIPKKGNAKECSNYCTVALISHASGLPWWETRVWSLRQEDLLEKEMATHSSTLVWKIPWTEEPGGLQSMGLQRVRHDWKTSLSLSFTC